MVPPASTSSVPYRDGLHAFRPVAEWTPARCAEMPTHAYPSLRRCSCVWNQSTSWSHWLLTLYHSATTTPLNALAERGRRTTMRVLYGWPVLRTVPVAVPLAEYRVAWPEIWNSCST